MGTSHKCLGVVLLAGVSALVLNAAPAQAQFYNFNPNAYGNRYYGGYGNAYNLPDPYSGNLYGSAAVINAQGQLMLDTQRAYSMQQDVKRSKIDTKRKAFDEYLYERANTPTQEEERTRARMQEFQRSRNDPPLTEIWSGKALNDMLLDIQMLQASHAYAQTVIVDPVMLKRIHLTTGTTSGSVGVLKGDKLRWPLALMDAAYDKERKQVDKLAAAASKQAAAGEVEPETLRDLIAGVKKLSNHLRSQIADIPSNQYVQAKRYITQLEDATKTLQDPNASNYFNKWNLQGQHSVAEIVKYMTGNGLKFAPSTSGDEPYYTALHRAMANYDVALNQSVAGASMTTQAPRR